MDATVSKWQISKFSPACQVENVGSVMAMEKQENVFTFKQRGLQMTRYKVAEKWYTGATFSVFSQ
jgi:hypothetical protein